MHCPYCDDPSPKGRGEESDDVATAAGDGGEPRAPALGRRGGGQHHHGRVSQEERILELTGRRWFSGGVR